MVTLMKAKVTSLQALTEEAVSWEALRHDRERHIFIEAFWLGASFGIDLERGGYSQRQRLPARMREVARSGA